MFQSEGVHQYGQNERASAGYGGKDGGGGKFSQGPMGAMGGKGSSAKSSPQGAATDITVVSETA